MTRMRTGVWTVGAAAVVFVAWDAWAQPAEPVPPGDAPAAEGEPAEPTGEPAEPTEEGGDEGEGEPSDIPPPPPGPATTPPAGPAAPGSGQPGRPAGPPGYPPPGGYGQSGNPPPGGYGERRYPPPSGYAQPGYGQPGYYGYGPPPPPPSAPPPPSQKGIYRHDGFYLRMGIGGGGFNLEVEPADDTATFEIQAGGLIIDLGVGGTPVDGFVIGGRLVGMTGTDPSVKVGDDERDTGGDVTFSKAELFTDVYPWPDEGVHFLGAVGPAAIGYNHESMDSGESHTTMGGFGVTLGAGWEGWVGKEWSIGGMLSLNWAWLEDEEVDFLRPTKSGDSFEMVYSGKATAKLFVPTLSFAATFQ